MRSFCLQDLAVRDLGAPVRTPCGWQSRLAINASARDLGPSADVAGTRTGETPRAPSRKLCLHWWWPHPLGFVLLDGQLAQSNTAHA